MWRFSKQFFYFFTKNAMIMTLNIHAVHFDADEKLTEHVKRKVSKLSTYHDRIVKVDVFLKLDNVVHQIKDKVAEIKVSIPRSEIFVKSSSKSFEESFDDAFESVCTQVKRKKEKLA
jgi:putative sigma-54 modulation protein